MTFYSLLAGPLKPKPKLILTEFQGLTLSTPSLAVIVKNCFIWLKNQFKQGPNPLP